MRILVVSDTHGDRWALSRALSEQPKAKTVFFLGDGEDEAKEALKANPERKFYLVRGNCDWGSKLPWGLLVREGGKKIFLTHGYAENVKRGMSGVLRTAKDEHADILVFGHTHHALVDYRDGLYILNPGTLHGSQGTYGYIDITPAGIVTNIVNLR